MKIIYLAFAISLTAISGCKKDSKDPVYQDPSKAVQKEISGRWTVTTISTKTIQKNVDGGQILSPDGTPVDTVRSSKTFTDAYLQLDNTLSLYYGGEYLYQNKSYEVQNEGKSIQIFGGERFDITSKTSNTLTLYSKLQTIVSNYHYTEYYTTYQLKR